MYATHNAYDPYEEPQVLDEVTGTNNSYEISTVNKAVEISDEEIMEILNYALRIS